MTGLRPDLDQRKLKELREQPSVRRLFGLDAHQPDAARQDHALVGTPRNEVLPSFADALA